MADFGSKTLVEEVAQSLLSGKTSDGLSVVPKFRAIATPCRLPRQAQAENFMKVASYDVASKTKLTKRKIVKQRRIVKLGMGKRSHPRGCRFLGKRTRCPPVVPARDQIEYYFSVANIYKDMYLQSRMDSNGWVGLGEIIMFPRMRSLGTCVAAAAKCIENSLIVEVSLDRAHVRIRSAAVREELQKGIVKPQCKSPSQVPSGVSLPFSSKAFSKGLLPKASSKGFSKSPSLCFSKASSQSFSKAPFPLFSKASSSGFSKALLPCFSKAASTCNSKAANTAGAARTSASSLHATLSSGPWIHSEKPYMPLLKSPPSLAESLPNDDGPTTLKAVTQEHGEMQRSPVVSHRSTSPVSSATFTPPSSPRKRRTLSQNRSSRSASRSSSRASQRTSASQSTSPTSQLLNAKRRRSSQRLRSITPTRAAPDSRLSLSPTEVTFLSPSYSPVPTTPTLFTDHEDKATSVLNASEVSIQPQDLQKADSMRSGWPSPKAVEEAVCASDVGASAGA